MRSLHVLFLPLLVFFALSSSAQEPAMRGEISNARTVTVKIDGDCPMCETRIERVGFVQGLSAVDWVVETHRATITYDSTRTDLDAILQRVAQAGYDNELYRAPMQAYDNLPGCCQYERTIHHAPVLEPPADTLRIRTQGDQAPAGAVPSVSDKPGYKGTPEDKEP